MSRVPSIPPEHQQTVVDEWLCGASPRHIAKTMRSKHGVKTTHTSVQRLLDSVASGCHREALAAVTMRLRLQTSVMATELEDLRNRTLERVGLRGSGPKVQTAEDLRELTAYDKAERLVARQLKMAGVGSHVAAEITDSFKDKALRRSAQAGARDGIHWWMEYTGNRLPPERPIVSNYNKPHEAVVAREAARAAAQTAAGATPAPGKAATSPLSDPAKTHPITTGPAVPPEPSRPDRAPPAGVAATPAEPVAKPALPAPALPAAALPAPAVLAPVEPAREVQRLIASDAPESLRIESYAQVGAAQVGSCDVIRPLVTPPARAAEPAEPVAAVPPAPDASVSTSKVVLPAADARQPPGEPKPEVQRLIASESPESRRIESCAEASAGRPAAGKPVEAAAASAPARAESTGEWGPGVPGWKPGRTPPPPTRAARREAVALEARARDESRAPRPATREAGR